MVKPLIILEVNEVKIYVLSRYQLAHYIPDRKYKDSLHALISIRNPGAKLATYIHVFDKVLHLTFWDMSGDIPGTPYKIIQYDQVAAITAFVDSLPDDCVLVVQCEAGISRSAGVAAAIDKYANDSPADWIFKSGKFVPNMTVYNKVLNAFMESVYKNPNGN